MPTRSHAPILSVPCCWVLATGFVSSSGCDFAGCGPDPGNGSSSVASSTQQFKAPSRAEELALSSANFGAHPAAYNSAAAAEDAGQCDAGSAASCLALGQAHLHGTGVERSGHRAAALFHDACEHGEPLACDHLGYMVLSGQGGLSKDDRRAVALFRTACDGGAVAGCRNLAASYAEGIGIEKDVASAVSYYRKACDGGCADGCNGLGWLHEHGDGVSRNLAEAAALYRKACDGGTAPGCLGRSAPACANLAFFHLKGLGGLPRDMSSARRLLREACDGGDGRACLSVANNAVGSLDPREAEHFRKRACELGVADACAPSPTGDD